MAVLYVSGGKAIMFYRCTFFLFFFLFFIQTLISEVTERIPLTLSHNIRSGCNLIMHPLKLVDRCSPQKNQRITLKMGILEIEFDIKWRIT